jgi:butyryl-CoA dehydrogenase
VKYAKERRQFGKAIAEFGLIKQKLAGMAIRGFIGDAMSYRTLGDVDRALQSVDRDGASGPVSDIQVLKTIEGFAVECSINKVWTSEALAWTVDEAIQVFGGNGYSREFPVERMYRDARITRIYEGTNEINRMLIPARLMKQSASWFTADAARRALESGANDVVSRTKRLAIALLGQAAATYGDALKEAQEVQAQIADVVIEAYAIESGTARADKLSARGDSRASLARDVVDVYASDAVDRITAATKQVVAALSAHGSDDSLACGVPRLLSFAPIDAIAARRRIADAVIEAGKHPF